MRIISICVLFFLAVTVGLAQIAPAATVNLDSKSETPKLVRLNLDLQKQQAMLNTLQGYLATAKAKAQTEQIAILTSSVAEHQSTVNQLTAAQLKYENQVLVDHKLSPGALFSADFTTATGPVI